MFVCPVEMISWLENQSWLHCLLVAILVFQKGTRTSRLHIGLCKFVKTF